MSNICAAGQCEWCGCSFRKPTDVMYHRCAAMQKAAQRGLRYDVSIRRYGGLGLPEHDEAHLSVDRIDLSEAVQPHLDTLCPDDRLAIEVWRSRS